MRKLWIFCICVLAFSTYCYSIAAQETKKQEEPAATKESNKKKSDYEDFEKVIEDSKSFQGLYRLYQKKENLYCEIQPNQLNKPFLCMLSISRGIGTGRILSGMNGYLNGDALEIKSILFEKMSGSVPKKEHQYVMQ